MGKNLDNKILEILKQVGIPEPGVHHLAILHDENCPALKSQRLADCNCVPDIRKMKTEQ